MGSLHWRIYRPLPVGNFVKPPLITAEAGLRLVSGLLEKTNVSARAAGAEKIAEAMAAIAIRIVLFRTLIFSLLSNC
jgi:hypothetical protein